MESTKVYCKKCGTELIENRRTEVFDPKTGKKTEEVILLCPVGLEVIKKAEKENAKILRKEAKKIEDYEKEMEAWNKEPWYVKFFCLPPKLPTITEGVMGSSLMSVLRAGAEASSHDSKRVIVKLKEESDEKQKAKDFKILSSRPRRNNSKTRVKQKSSNNKQVGVQKTKKRLSKGK